MKTKLPKKTLARLEKILDASFKKRFPKIPMTIKDQAISEIIDGVRFCIMKKLKISVTLSRHFDIGNPCECLVARNAGTVGCDEREFYSVLLALQIRSGDAAKMGFVVSDAIERLLDKYQPKKNWVETWERIYNYLWRTVGRFFRDNPRLGVA